MKQSTHPLLSVIVVSFNTKDLTVNTLNSVAADVDRTPRLRNKCELIVVDNHSQDGSVEAVNNLEFEHCSLQVIVNQENKGFAHANNQGIERSQGQYIFLLNSDAVVQPHCLDKLITALDSYPDNSSTAQLSSFHGRLDQLGIAAAQLKNKDGSIQPQGGSFPNLWSLANHMLLIDDLPLIGKLLPSTQHTGLRFKPKLQAKKTLIQKDWVGGTAMMIDRAVVNEIGALDPNIFMYGEDIEFCLRARHHHWDVAVHTEAEATHVGSASSSSEQALLGEIKGYLYIWAKHKPVWQIPILKLLIWLGCWLRIFLFSFKQDERKKVKTYKQALTLLG